MIFTKTIPAEPEIKITLVLILMKLKEFLLKELIFLEIISQKNQSLEIKLKLMKGILSIQSYIQNL